MGKELTKGHKVYVEEELHRGKWKPVTFEKEVNGKKETVTKTVTISPEDAKTMNIDSKATGVRYVLKGKKNDDGGSGSDDNVFNHKKANRTTLLKYVEEKEIPFTAKKEGEPTVAELREAIDVWNEKQK